MSVFEDPRSLDRKKPRSRLRGLAGHGSEERDGAPASAHRGAGRGRWRERSTVSIIVRAGSPAPMSSSMGTASASACLRSAPAAGNFGGSRAWFPRDGAGRRCRIPEERNSTVHKILRKRAYTGEFTYKGKLYTGVYEPLISVELWEEVQAVLDGRPPQEREPGLHRGGDSSPSPRTSCSKVELPNGNGKWSIWCFRTANGGRGSSRANIGNRLILLLLRLRGALDQKRGQTVIPDW